MKPSTEDSTGKCLRTHELCGGRRSSESAVIPDKEHPHAVSIVKRGSNNKCVPSWAAELVKFSNKWNWSSAPLVDGLLLSAAGFARLFCGRGRDCRAQPHPTQPSPSYFGGLLPYAMRRAKNLLHLAGAGGASSTDSVRAACGSASSEDVMRPLILVHFFKCFEH